MWSCSGAYLYPKPLMRAHTLFRFGLNNIWELIPSIHEALSQAWHFITKYLNLCTVSFYSIFNHTLLQFKVQDQHCCVLSIHYYLKFIHIYFGMNLKLTCAIRLIWYTFLWLGVFALLSEQYPHFSSWQSSFDL